MRFPILIFSYSSLLLIYGIINIILSSDPATINYMPMVFGGIILIMGIMSVNKDFVLFGQHGATALSLVAFITSLIGFVEVFNEQSESFYSNLTDVYLASLSIFFLVLAVRQFGIDRKENPSG